MCQTVKKLRSFTEGNLGFSGSNGGFAKIAKLSGSIKGRFGGILDRELLIFQILDKDVSEMPGSLLEWVAVSCT